MALTLLQLPQDVLVLICLFLSVEDLLALKQTCRVMHALGSLDYLWHKLITGLDLPLDIPLDTPIASLSSTVLRDAVTTALKLDHRWRDPTVYLQSTKRVISPNTSFVDGLRLLPGGRWLVTTQYEQTLRTHVTLWSLKNPSDAHAVFKITVNGRVRFLQAHQQVDKVTIGIAFARGPVESINVYDVFVKDLAAGPAAYTAIFETSPEELSVLGQIAGMKICGRILVAVFAPLSASLGEGKILCLNISSRAAIVIQPERSFSRGSLKLFRTRFALVTSPYATAFVKAYFYDLPGSVLDENPPPSVSRWPFVEAIDSLPVVSASWGHGRTFCFELSDDPAGDNDSLTLVGCPILAHNVTNGIMVILRVSLTKFGIRFSPTFVPCQSLPLIGDIQASASGRRAIWLQPNPDTNECTLVRFASGRVACNMQLEPRISVLMPSFSGLPFNPRDFHIFAFDEISCRLAVSVSSGELYILDY